MKREAKLEEIIWKYLCAVIDLEDGKQLAQAIAQDEKEMLEGLKHKGYDSTVLPELQDMFNQRIDKALANFGGEPNEKT